MPLTGPSGIVDGLAVVLGVALDVGDELAVVLGLWEGLGVAEGATNPVKSMLLARARRRLTPDTDVGFGTSAPFHPFRFCSHQQQQQQQAVGGEVMAGAALREDGRLWLLWSSAHLEHADGASTVVEVRVPAARRQVAALCFAVVRGQPRPNLRTRQHACCRQGRQRGVREASSTDDIQARIGTAASYVAGTNAPHARLGSGHPATSGGRLPATKSVCGTTS